MKTIEKLKPCPFCGGEVKEMNPSWNLANAKCNDCDAEWGYCGAKFDGRYKKFNKRYIK